MLIEPFVSIETYVIAFKKVLSLPQVSKYEIAICICGRALFLCSIGRL